MTYYYKLEDIETTGKTTLHGPVSAMPQAGAVAEGSSGAEGIPSDTECTGPALITYGDPAANRFEVIDRRRGQVTLELETEGFYAEPQEDGTVRIVIPGLDGFSEGDPLSIPVKRTRVDAVAGRKVEVLPVKVSGVEAIEGLQPSSAEAPEIEASPRATVRAGRYEDVFGRRRRGIKASSIRLSRRGETVAFHLGPNQRRFGPGSFS